MFAASKTAKVASAAAPTDPQFNYVTMLLHGDGTNGAQNNTFLDSSTNNFTITRNGNTTQGTFSPYGANWSNYFSSNSGLTAPNNSAFKPATNDFTVECWIFSTATGQQVIYGDSDSATNNGVLDLYLTSSGFLASDYWTSSSGVTTRTSTLAPTINQWNHVLVSRTGTTMYIGLNGVLQSFTAPSSYQSPATIYPTVGRLGAYAAGVGFIGYISNFRYINGTNLYSGSTYTVPTAPLTAVANTQLLTCADNRFIDDSTNAFSLTVNGTPSVQRFSPFAPTSAYSTSVIGGSGYFDGSGDYLRVAYNSNLYPTSSGTDYTVECWVYPTAGTGGLQFILGTNNTTVADWTFTQDAGQWGFTLSGVGGNAGTVIANQWTHLAMTRNGTTVNGYVNGARVLTTTASTQSNNGLPVNIGMRNGSDRAFTGYITDVRIVNGTAVYTGTSYTVPTAPLTAVTNTQFLSNNTNAGILDNAEMNDLETVGNAQISTSVYKYGTGSISMTSSGDYCKGSQPSIVYDIAGGNFTIEFWVYFTSLAADRALISKYGNAAENAGGLGYVLQWVQSSSVLRLVLGVGGGSDALYTWSWAPSTSTWYHVAVTRSGTSGRAFINGTQIGTTSTLSTSDVASPNVIQLGKTHTVAQYLLGYMDDVRITKGYARYTSNFTAPTAAFPNN